MANGSIEIKYELRTCIVHIEPEQDVKSLFHCWHPGTGNGIAEYGDGTVHEVDPQNIRFVDNVMSEYAFPEMEG